MNKTPQLEEGYQERLTRESDRKRREIRSIKLERTYNILKK